MVVQAYHCSVGQPINLILIIRNDNANYIVAQIIMIIINIIKRTQILTLILMR